MRIHTATVLASFALLGCTEAERTPGTELLITNVRIVSADSATGTAAKDVYVDEGRIVSIEDSGRHGPGAAVVLDGSGRFLAPGLIDSHTHLNEIPGMTLEHERAYAAIAASAREQIPRSYLYHGFTTVIDLNAQPAVIDAWNSHATAPRAFFCGASPVFDGYPMSFMPKPERYEIMPYFLFDESRSDEFPTGIEPQLHMPKAVVDRISADGGICLKTHYERGFGGRGDLPVPSAPLIETLVSAAHDKGLPVLIHANSESAQRFAIGTGVDAFAHGMWTWDDRSVTDLHDGIEQLIDAAIDANIALQPTIQVLYGEQDIHNPAYLEDPRLRHVLPAVLIDWYRTDDGQWWRQRMLKIPAVARLVEEGRWQELDAPPIARVSGVLAHFSKRGGHLLFGSDTPSDPTFANPPGLNGRLEMQRWIEAGVPPDELFAAATINNAQFFGLDHEVGTVAVGKRADLLLLTQDPRKTVAAYDSIDYVIVAGKAIERQRLSALETGR